MKRRNFLKIGLGTALSPIMINGIPFRTLASPNYETMGLLSAENDKVIVLIQLNGGNDGLNTVIPLDKYNILSNARKNIFIPENDVIKLSDNTGLHPVMTGLEGLFKESRLEVVQSVGYPNQNFSHFRSTDIWTSASDADKVITSGWLGRYLSEYHPDYPESYPNTENPDPLSLTIGSVVSDTCQGPVSRMGMAIPATAEFYKISSSGIDVPPDTYAGPELEYIRSVISQTQVYSVTIESAAKKGQNLSAKYPAYGKNKLADQLKIVAKLISGGLKTKIYICNIGGFDTHSNQVQSDNTKAGSHANLLKDLSEAIEIFQDDLRLLKIEDRVIGMTLSEFGRRIISNASMGTDHGAAAPLFLFGSMVNPVIHGSSPNLPEIPKTNDNVQMQFDFRRIYYSLLLDWFDVSKEILKKIMLKEFEYIQLIRKTSSVDDISSHYNFNIYPNPASNYVNLSAGSNDIIENYSITNMNGQVLVNSSNYSSNINVDLSEYSSGTYYINTIINGRRFSEKLIIRK